MKSRLKSKSASKVRYAVVGLGHISQMAILPAFKAAKANSEIVALVTGSKEKKKELSKLYDVDSEMCFNYDEFDQLLSSGLIDAVYIALPNHVHKEYTIRALNKGIHVLCEKPLAVTAHDCLEMNKVALKNKKFLMTAYRLHLEESNLKALEIIKNKTLGKLRYFNANFSFQVEAPNIRLKEATGGGPISDIGIYCINAARSLFQSNPIEVFASEVKLAEDSRFREVEETVAVNMKFPDERIANFVCSFGADTTSNYSVVGTESSLYLENAFDYEPKRRLDVKKDNKRISRFHFKKVDQFAAEINYFSSCVINNVSPNPNAVEALYDVAIIQAIHQSLKNHRVIKINYPISAQVDTHPKTAMKSHFSSHRKPKTVEVEAPHN